jgi:hypothetical protein
LAVSRQPMQSCPTVTRHRSQSPGSLRRSPDARPGNAGRGIPFGHDRRLAYCCRLGRQDAVLGDHDLRRGIVVVGEPSTNAAGRAFELLCSGVAGHERAPRRATAGPPGVPSRAQCGQLLRPGALPPTWSLSHRSSPGVRGPRNRRRSPERRSLFGGLVLKSIHPESQPVSSAGLIPIQALRPRGDGTFGSIPPVPTAQFWR